MNPIRPVLLTILATFLVCPRGNALLAEPPESFEDVIRLVRENEKLFQNFELRFSIRYTSPVVEEAPPEPRDVGGFTVIATSASTKNVHVVHQDDRFYYRVDSETEMANGDSRRSRFGSMFDGAITTTQSEDSEPNKTPGRQPNSGMTVSNSLPYDSWNCPKPLSKYLASGGRNRTVYRWQRIGREEFEGLQCQVVEIDCSVGGVPGWYRSRFWLAEDRNYFPVGIVTYKPRSNDQLPVSVSTASEFRELRPGVWYPNRIAQITYDQGELRTGKMVPHHRREIVVESMRLDPAYKESFFSTVDELATPSKEDATAKDTED